MLFLTNKGYDKLVTKHFFCSFIPVIYRNKVIITLLLLGGTGWTISNNNFITIKLS